MINDLQLLIERCKRYDWTSYKRDVEHQTISNRIHRLLSALQDIENLKGYIDKDTALLNATISEINLAVNRIIEYKKTFAEENHQGAMGTNDAVIILLGCSNTRGFLDERIDKAIALLRQKDLPIILSGGGMVDDKTEAAHMFERIKKTFPNKKNIYLEEDSKDTVGNAIFSRFAAIEHNLQSMPITLVTHFFHISRALELFKKVFGRIRIDGKAVFVKSGIEPALLNAVIKNELVSLYLTHTTLDQALNMYKEDESSDENGEKWFYLSILKNPHYKDQTNLIAKFKPYLSFQ